MFRQNTLDLKSLQPSNKPLKRQVDYEKRTIYVEF